MHKLLLRLWKHLSRKKKLHFSSFFMLMLIGSMLEVVSLSSILPFLAAITDINSIKAYPFISDILAYYHLTEPKQVVLLLTVVFIAAILISGGTRLLLLFLGTKLSFSSGHELSVDIYRRTLSQTYESHTNRNSSEIIAGISTKVSSVTMILKNSVLLLNSFVLIIIVSVALILLNPIIAILSAVSFIIFYGLVTWLVHGKLKVNSNHISTESTKAIKIVQEGMNGIRDIILDSSQNLYCAMFSKSDLKLKNAQSSNIFIAASPKFLMESFGMIVVAMIAFSLYSTDNSFANSLPFLGALAIGAQRMLPAAQQSFSAWSSITGAKYVLIDVLELLDQSELIISPETDIKPLPLKSTIELTNLSFRYNINQHNALSNVNIKIEKGTKVAFIGSTGSGKSTAIDLIMGLLKPTTGHIAIDGLILKDKYLRNWQKSISHVPQSVFLSDTTIEKNIIFDTHANTKDSKLLENVLDQAQLLDFVKNKQKKYNTNVGESGVNLSGGQIQRIGIARALYKKANILVLDEATSALDSITEKRVLKAISENNKDLTIIIVTHRLSTIKNCDVIYEFEEGKVISQGTYDELLNSSVSFEKMTKT